ncbi:MAG: VCBS repeat-containing protein, partial [Planctomycetota bacterium]
MLVFRRGGRSVRLSMGQSDGTLSLPAHIATVPDAIASLAAGDVNGDGQVDLVAVTFGREIHSLVRTGDEWVPGPITAWSQVLFSNTAEIELIDVNGDGSRDLVVTRPNLFTGTFTDVRVGLGAGDGSFAPFQSLVSNGEAAVASRFADVDSDGDLDLVACGYAVAGAGFFPVAVIRNDGAFPFDGANVTLIGTPDPIVQDLGVVVADEEGDGDLDIFFWSALPGGSTVEIASGDGAGGFSA